MTWNRSERNFTKFLSSGHATKINSTCQTCQRSAFACFSPKQKSHLKRRTAFTHPPCQSLRGHHFPQPRRAPRRRPRRQWPRQHCWARAERPAASWLMVWGLVGFMAFSGFLVVLLGLKNVWCFFYQNQRFS